MDNQHHLYKLDTLEDLSQTGDTMERRHSLKFKFVLLLAALFFVILTFTILRPELGPIAVLRRGEAIPPILEPVKFENFYFTEEEHALLSCPKFLRDDKRAVQAYVNHGRAKLIEGKMFDLPMDCESIRARVHGDILEFPRTNRSVAFLRNTFRIYEVQEAFLSISYHPNNTFCYVLDSKCSNEMKAKMRKLEQCFSNVHVMDKEYDFDSKGHKQNRAHFDCLSHILNKTWDHALLLQSDDLIIKSVEQISKLSQILNTTSIMGMGMPTSSRFDRTADWTPHALHLFKNDSNVSDEILHKKLVVRKGLNEVIVAKPFVKSIFEKLDLTAILKQFDDEQRYGVDEMLIQTLFSNYLGLEGQLESNCSKKYGDSITRSTQWNYYRKMNGYETMCKSKWKRHGICILGVEYMPKLKNSRYIIANKVLAVFDFGTIICTREMLRNKSNADIVDEKFLMDFPQFDEALHHYRQSSKRNSAGEGIRSLESMRTRFRWIKSRKILDEIVKYEKTGVFPKNRNEQLMKLSEDLKARLDDLLNEGHEVHDKNLKMMALAINDEKQYWPKFKASDSWISRWKRCYRIVSRHITVLVSQKTKKNEEKTKVLVDELRKEVEEIVQLHPGIAIWNADQSGLLKEQHGRRTLAQKGVKKVEALAQSMSATTHSITLLPVIGHSGYQNSKLFVQLGEPGGKLPQRGCYQSPATSKAVLEIAVNKSHIMGKEEAIRFYKNVLFQAPLPSKILLILDSWPAFKDHDTIRSCCPPHVELFIKNIPPGATSYCQPADLSYNHAVKGIQRAVTTTVITLQIPYQISQRDNLLRLVEQIHWTLGADRFKNFIQYGFYKGGFIPNHPGYFESPKQFLFGDGSTDPCMCTKRGCTLCPHCSKVFCFHCYWENMHRC